MQYLLRFYRYQDETRQKAIPYGSDSLVDEKPDLGYGSITVGPAENNDDVYRVASLPSTKLATHPTESDQTVILFKLLIVPAHEWQSVENTESLFIELD